MNVTGINVGVIFLFDTAVGRITTYIPIGNELKIFTGKIL